MKLTDAQRVQTQHICVFGDPKSGKSTLVSELAEHGLKLLWISMDNGHDVLWKLSLKAQENIELILLPDTKDYSIAADTIRKIIDGGSYKICDAHGKIDCAVCKKQVDSTWTAVELGALDKDTIPVFDNLSVIADSVMNNIMRGEKDPSKPEWPDYRKQGYVMDQLLTKLQQAPYSWIAITHTATANMEDGKKKLGPHVGTDNFSRNGGKYFDHIIYCQIVNKNHKFGSNTTYEIGVITGSRSDVEIEKLEKPTLVSFFGNNPPAKRKEYGSDIVASGSKSAISNHVATVSKQEIVSEKIADTTAAEPAGHGQPTQRIEPVISAEQATVEAVGDNALNKTKAALAALKKLREGK